MSSRGEEVKNTDLRFIVAYQDSNKIGNGQYPNKLLFAIVPQRSCANIIVNESMKSFFDMKLSVKDY